MAQISISQKVFDSLKKAAAIAAVSAIALSTASCAKSDDGFKFGQINIPGLDGSLCGAPIYIAYENGYFAEEGFDVTLISADTETRKIGLNNGTIPIVNGDFQFFPSMEQGVNTIVVDKLHDGCIKIVVRPDSDINSPEDLIGLRIGVDEIGGTPHQVASVWLENAGISALQEDHEVEFLPFADGNLELEALYNGDIDAAAMWDPLASIAESNGDVRTILDITTDEPFAGRACCFLYASRTVYENNPEEVAALLRAYRRAQDFINNNPEEAVDIIINGNYSQIEDRDLAIELITSYNYPSYEQRESGAFDVQDDVRYFAQQLYDIGYLSTDPDTYTSQYYVDVNVDDGQ